MDAREFYNEFVRNTNEEAVWDDKTGRGRTYREIYKTDEPAYTELVNKHIIHDIVEKAGYVPQHEYFRVDTIGWKDAGYREMEDAKNMGLNRHLWNLMIAAGTSQVSSESCDRI